MLYFAWVGIEPTSSDYKSDALTIKLPDIYIEGCQMMVFLSLRLYFLVF